MYGARAPYTVKTNQIMKFKISTITAMVAVAVPCVQSAFGQANMLPVSRTAGVVTVDLSRGKATLLSLSNQKIIANGRVTATGVGSLTLTSNPSALPDLVSTPHAVKVVSRTKQLGANAYGLSARITSQNGQELTASLPTNPEVGDECIVYTLSTIASLFGDTNSIGLNAASTPATADIVYISNAGALTAIFYHSGVGKWRLVGDVNGSDQNNTVIPPDSGVLVARKNSGPQSIFLPLRGDALPGRHAIQVSPGLTIANYPFALPTTLGSSGIRNHVNGGTGAGAADVVYLENNGVLTGYFYKTGGVGGIGWRALGDSVTDRSSVAINPGKAILFKEQSGAAGFAIPEPFN